jgi:hypothetical protein
MQDTPVNREGMMSTLQYIAYYQNRRDEVPNQQLARKLAENKDLTGIKEIAENLWNKNQNIQSDCLKVLYEIGYLNPELIVGYSDKFAELLKSMNNRMVWGGMIALATISSYKAEVCYPHLENIIHAVEQGSLITRVNGIKILTNIVINHDDYRKRLVPYLFDFLQNCDSKYVAQFSEIMVKAVDHVSRDSFVRLLDGRLKEISRAQALRVKRVIKTANQIGN